MPILRLYLTDDQAEALGRLASATDLTIGEEVRKSVDARLQAVEARPLPHVDFGIRMRAAAAAGAE